MGSAMGVYSFAGILSAILAAVISGWIKDVTGSLVAAFYLAAVLVLAGAAAMVAAREPGQA